MAGTEIRPADKLLAKRVFVDFPFRLHGHDPNWAPPLRLSVYDRLSRRHPASQHQQWALWTAHRGGKVVGRIGACVDSLFNERQGEAWAWVGFFDSVDDEEVAGSLFDVALDWSRRQGPRWPSDRPTSPPTTSWASWWRASTPRLPCSPCRTRRTTRTSGWGPAGNRSWTCTAIGSNAFPPGLSERQRKTLERLRERSKVYVRDMNMKDYDAEVGRFFEIYNAIWQDNWGFVPMPEAEVRHLAKQTETDPQPPLGVRPRARWRAGGRLPDAARTPTS